MRRALVVAVCFLSCVVGVAPVLRLAGVVPMLHLAGVDPGTCMAGVALAEEAKRAESVVTLSWDEFVRITGFDARKDDGQVLTIPWSEVEQLLGVKVERVGEGATLKLPWSEFKALLQWSVEQSAKQGDEKPPLPYVVTGTELTAELDNEQARFVMELSLEILGEPAWRRVPVLPATVAVTDFKLPEGVFLNATSDRYELLTRSAGAITATLEFSVSVQKVKGINQVGFARVTPGSSLLDLTIDRENVEVTVAGAQSQISKSAGGRTHVAAAIPSGRSLSVSWERALPKVEAAPTKLYAETRTLAAVAEGVLLCREAVLFNILHTPVHELELTVPKGVSVLTVEGANVQDWRVDGNQVLQVVLRGEALGSQRLDITYELPASERTALPVIGARGVERQKGFIGVVAISNLEIGSAELSGARAIDTRQLPGELVAMTKQPILLAFRYAGDTFSIPLTINKHKEIGTVVTIVDSVLFTTMQLNDGRRITRAVYNVRNNRSQFLRMNLEEGAELWSVEVAGKAVTPARDQEGRILLPLVRSASSAQELTSFPVEMVYVEAPDTPAPEAGKLVVTFPAVDVPVMHHLVNLYLPAEGDYESLLGGSHFSGPLRQVDYFASLLASPAPEEMIRNADVQAMQMQSQIDARVDAEARAAGAQPIRVQLPLNGQLYRFEKILVLPGDALWLSVRYQGWEVPENE